MGHAGRYVLFCQIHSLFHGQLFRRFAGALQQEDELALEVVVRVGFHGVRQRGAEDFLMDFGEFPYNDELPVPESGQQVPQGAGQLVRRLVQDDGAGEALQKVQLFVPQLFVDGQEALEQEAAGVHAGEGQRRGKGRGSGDGLHGDAVLVAERHQVLSGVRDGGHAGVRAQHTVFAGQQAVQDLRTGLRLVVFMVTDQRFAEVKMGQELARYPGIFGRNEVTGRQRLHGARREVSEVADGRAEDGKQSGCITHVASPVL